MKLNKMRINVTTAADQTGSGTGDRTVHGLLYAVQLIDGDFADGVDVTLTFVSEATTTALVKADFNTDSMYYPRDLVHASSDGAALTGTSGGDRCLPIMYGLPTVAIAQGGATKTGGVILHFYENE